MQTRFCAHCSDEIPYHRNRNSRFCCYECYYENKKSAAVIANKKKVWERELLRNDEITHELYSVYQSSYYLSASELIKRNFSWNIYSGEVLIQGNIKAKKLIRYAYTLFNNQTFQLWKL